MEKVEEAVGKPDSPAAMPPALRLFDAFLTKPAKPEQVIDTLARVLTRVKPGASLVLDVVDQSGPRRVTVVVGTRPKSLGG